MYEFNYGNPDEWEWVPISTVLTWYSVDAGISVRCPDCNRSIDEIDEAGTSFDMICYACDKIIQYTMDEVLDDKRADDDYGDVLDSVRSRGWVMPLHRWNNCVTDGHHRLAAAIDLGHRVVPMHQVDDCRTDHGDWQEEIDHYDTYREMSNA